MAKSKKIRDLNPTGRKPYGVFSRFEEYFNLLKVGILVCLRFLVMNYMVLIRLIVMLISEEYYYTLILQFQQLQFLFYLYIVLDVYQFLPHPSVK